ncbi:MAG: sigma 54-interacting transcriptional regulator [Nitrospiraceae bacterium]|nr:sigma 54-interacting transcriptional regulator [Nitrospiraceae bacterium]
MGTLSVPRDHSNLLSALLRARTLREFDQRLQHDLAPALGCDLIGFYLYSRTTGVFTPISESLRRPESPAYVMAQLPSEGTLKEAAVRGHRALLVDDVAQSPWTEAGALAPNLGRATSVMVTPVTAVPSRDRGGESRTLAVLAAVAIGKPGFFSEDDRIMFEQFGLHLAPVLEAVLAAEERDALVAINSQVVLGTMTIDNLLPAVQPILRQVIHHDMTGLVRFVGSPDNPWFDIVSCDGVSVDLEALRRFPFHHMAPAELLATGKPVLLTGYNQDRFAEHGYFESIGVLSAMLCPLLVSGKPYGFLALGSKRRNAFSERDLGLAEQIAFHLSHALSNLTAYDEIRRLKERLEEENVYLREEMGAVLDLKTLIGDSPTFQRSLKAIEKVAPTDSTVLITGETGTGKELVAQAIHRLSGRRHKPIVAVNCAALPPTLIESELFGHERGAFTGATTRKLGRFELAHTGTIFLDEVGDLPLDLQAKLLRVLETQEFDRVGGRTVRVDARVLAATNANLDQAVKQGTFRADLFYRLNVFPLRLPPLRERREDIPLLARHFVTKYATQHRKTVTRIDRTMMQRLIAYDWPGNVRELEHVIERAVILSQGPILTPAELDGLGTQEEPADAPRLVTMTDVERTHILNTLEQTNWVLSGTGGAAARLGMKRSTLQHRIKRLGIHRPPRTAS